MSKFYTEKEIEKYLEYESRLLVLPDGQKESVTVNHLTWLQFDILHNIQACSHEELVTRAYDWFKEDGRYDFATYFWNMVAFMFSHTKS